MVGTPFMDLVVVIFAPLLALSLAHAFSDALDITESAPIAPIGQRRHLLGIFRTVRRGQGYPLSFSGLVWLIVRQDPLAPSSAWPKFSESPACSSGGSHARRSGAPQGGQWLWATICRLLGFGIILIELAFTH